MKRGSVAWVGQPNASSSQADHIALERESITEFHVGVKRPDRTGLPNTMVKVPWIKVWLNLSLSLCFRFASRFLLYLTILILSEDWLCRHGPHVTSIRGCDTSANRTKQCCKVDKIHTALCIIS